MVEFWLGTFADPIYLGDWPESVKSRIPFIPKITPELVRPSPAQAARSSIALHVVLPVAFYAHCILQELTQPAMPHETVLL